ncbi:hypothetical protein [Aureivirga sp. CE67]|uniref:hypothetical protein n=1 Tax=Aureivirga sp. CE67 TaxID=1788983 RepID=UPI0018C9706E|nr:hypothetical protein [Aureivirga sp. CE67]
MKKTLLITMFLISNMIFAQQGLYNDLSKNIPRNEEEIEFIKSLEKKTKKDAYLKKLVDEYKKLKEKQKNYH